MIGTYKDQTCRKGLCGILTGALRRCSVRTHNPGGMIKACVHSSRSSGVETVDSNGVVLR